MSAKKDFLKAVNKAIFRPSGGWSISIPSILAAILLLASVVAVLLDGFDRIAKSLPSLLGVPSEELPGILPHIQPSWLAKGLFLLLILVFLYLMLFAYHALMLAISHKKEAEGWQKKLDEVSASGDYFEQTAVRTGLVLKHIKIGTEVLDWKGNGKYIGEFSLLPLSIPVHHFVRQLQSISVTDSEAPRMTAENIPAGIEVKTEFGRSLGWNYYHYYFSPALGPCDKPVICRLEQSMTQMYFMYKDAIPRDNWTLDEALETSSWWCIEPIELLEMHVTFPLGYSVREKNFVRVMYSQSRTPHPIEEKRLLDAGAVKRMVADGKQRLSMRVEKPRLGLRYILCWEPPSKKEFDDTVRKYTATEES